MAATTFSRPHGLEEVLAEPLLARGDAVVRPRQSARASPRQYVVFDVLDFLFAQPEVVPDLVNQRLADRANQVVVVSASRSCGPWNRMMRSGSALP